jgi:hypothetical protein
VKNVQDKTDHVLGIAEGADNYWTVYFLVEHLLQEMMKHESQSILEEHRRLANNHS